MKKNYSVIVGYGSVKKVKISKTAYIELFDN